MKQSTVYSIVMLGLLTGCATPNNPAIDIGETLDEGYIEANDLAHDVGRASVVVAKQNGAEILQHTYKFEQSAKGGFYHTVDRIANWIGPPEPPKPRQPVAASYCYQAHQDILCYRQPMPGWEHRLVGYQGTGALPPPPPVMIPLPTRASMVDQSPQNRVANAKPVFGEIPADVKQMKEEDEQQMPAPVNQTLPDPALAPQL